MNLERLHDTLTRVAEYLDDFSDVVDGSYGEPQPNQAMQLVQAVELELAIIERERLAATPRLQEKSHDRQ